MSVSESNAAAPRGPQRVEELSYGHVLAVMSAMDVAAVLHGPRAVAEYVNDDFARLLGYESTTAVVGKPVHEIVHLASMASRNRDARMLVDGEVRTLHVRRTLVHRTGRPVFAWVVKRQVSVEGRLLTLTMVTESADTPEALTGERERWLSEHDELTGLLNRRGLSNFVRSGAMQFPVAVVVIDIDGLKSLNDRYGHAAGDAAICAYASLLTAAAVPLGGAASRFGGDEFVVVLPTDVASPEWVDSDVCTAAMEIGGGRVELSATVGRAEARDLDGIDEARAVADLLMYEARSVRNVTRE
ncbi:GGDEF domain-containing protein [Williamsia sterculiae]|uniref:Diguanylate cyclase (GGDEF) domain-containing protein n=1 Tax=Williamsia sterculiae TaxID=1344003 RepID=A0A1N7FJ43_9NOCA|nr:GGDEF domain-containing protein [Williamsia sterculiae]SIS00382.1 diguanylate cyclase (GGDEF) domain-containing protein [Williamsia sterculiae]